MRLILNPSRLGIYVRLLDLSSTRLVSGDVDLPLSEMYLGCLFSLDVQVVESDEVVDKPVDASSFSDPSPLLEEIVDFIIEKIKYYVTLLASEKFVFSIKAYARSLQNTVFYMVEGECLVSAALLRLYHVPDVICGLKALDDFCRVVGNWFMCIECWMIKARRVCWKV